MKRFMKAVLCLVLTMLFVMAPLEAMAATTKIYTINADKVRVHSTAKQGLDNVITKLRKGTKVAYLGTSSRGWMKVRTERGVEGYVYKTYLSYNGAAKSSNLYKVKSSTRVYKKNSTKSGRVTTLAKNEVVVVYATKGEWAAIETLSGKRGFIKKSQLKK